MWQGLIIGKAMKNKKIISVVFLLAGLCLLGLSVYFIFFYNYEAYKRQEIEESLAEEYIEYVLENRENTEASSKEAYIIETEEASAETEISVSAESYIDDEGVKHIEVIQKHNDGILDFNDDNYYVGKDGTRFTPDYAAGSLFCVLSYPKCKIKRGIYSGTWEDRDRNLDMWIPNLANPFMNFDYTHITIEGHNHTSQNLSFNALNKSETGDEFYLVSDKGIYVYQVADIYSMSRDCVRKKLINDLTLGADKCFIVTCGRENFLVNHYRDFDYQNKKWIDSYFSNKSSRYYDYVVEGNLIEIK